MDPSLLEAFQKQVNAELYSAYLYLSMSSWCEEAGNMKGFAHWMRLQAQEEKYHGIFIHDYLIRRDAPSVMEGIAKPPSTWKDLVAMFEQVLEHEKSVTESINNIATLAMQCHDHASYQFIMQYVYEQVEEEETARDILAKLKVANGNPNFIYSLDQELGARTFSVPFGANQA